MKVQVQDIMTSSPLLICGAQSNLAEVAHLMWTGDCGIIPIADDAGKLLGVITDRDICIAAATQNKPPSEIHANELLHADLYACQPDDDASDALKLMRDHRVRRLPVIARDGTLQGMVSINDVVIDARDDNRVHGTEVLETLRSICAHRQDLEATTRPARAATPSSSAR